MMSPPFFKSDDFFDKLFWSCVNDRSTSHHSVNHGRSPLSDIPDRSSGRPRQSARLEGEVPDSEAETEWDSSTSDKNGEVEGYDDGGDSDKENQPPEDWYYDSESTWEHEDFELGNPQHFHGNPQHFHLSLEEFVEALFNTNRRYYLHVGFEDEMFIDFLRFIQGHKKFVHVIGSQPVEDEECKYTDHRVCQILIIYVW